jgi:hypothetical protein
VQRDEEFLSEQLIPLADDDPLLAPPLGSEPLLVDPRLDLLPTYELTPDNFEKLLLKVAQEVDGLREVYRYGVSGQRQDGLDVIGFDAQGRPHGYQGKRYSRFTVRNLTDAVDDYASGSRPFNVVRLVIGVAALAERTEIIKALRAQQEKHPGLEIELYDRRRLSDLLRDRPDIVETFFGESVAARFCLSSGTGAISTTPPGLDAVALADAVMRGPAEQAGVADVLAEADRRRGDQPEEAAAGYARVEEALEGGAFAGHALLIRRRRAAALRAAGRLDEAAELLAAATWLYLNQGDVDEARIVLHELNQTVGAEPPSTTPDAVTSQTRLLQQALDASVALVQDPINRMESLGTVVDQLVAERHPYAGRVTVLFAEIALAAEETGEIATRAAAFQELAADLARGSEEHRALSIRLRLCLADVSGEWDDLVDAARRRQLPNDQVALVLARCARNRAWQADPKLAESYWREAIERGCLAHLHEDAADWLYALRDLHIRYGPIDESLEEPHHLAQALLAAPGGKMRLLVQRRDPREVGLDRLRSNKLPAAADALRRYLRVSIITAGWTSQLDAHRLLGDLYARATEPAIAIHHLIRAGSAKEARELAADVGDHYIDVTKELERPAPWERAAAYQVIAAQCDLVPDDQASEIVERALNDIDDVLEEHALDMPRFGPGVYGSGYQAAAALADRSSVEQARRLLDRLGPLVPREPNRYRQTDDAHVDALVAIATAHPTLARDALDQLLGLLDGDGDVANRVLKQAQELFQEQRDAMLPRLHELAAGGSSHAARALGLLDWYDDEQRQRGQQALDRWAAPRHRRPGTVTYGTGAIEDSLLVRALPATHRATFAMRMLELAFDPDEADWNRRELLAAATNMVRYLEQADRAAVFEQAMRIAQGEHAPSRSDEGIPDMSHPLNRFRITLGGAIDLRPLGLELAARAVTTPLEAEAVQRTALELLRQADDKTIHQVAFALSMLPVEHLTLELNLLAAHPHTSLRMLAAIRWAQDPTCHPEMGLGLARDRDPRVRRMLAQAISDAPPQVHTEPARAVLRQDPRYSVRRHLQAAETQRHALDVQPT